MTTTSFLSQDFDEVEESVAEYRFELSADVLRISFKNGLQWFPANPFTFGAIFNGREHFGSESLFKLERFVVEQPGGSYATEFPYAKQVAAIQHYGPEELNVTIPEENALLLAKLYHSAFPIYWEWAVRDNSCVVYDGFYGRYLSGVNHEYFLATSYSELVESVFGVARKDTLREARSMNEDKLALAFVFQDVLPVDVILSVIREASKDFYDFSTDRENYSVLSRLSQPTIRRLMASVTNSNSTDPFLMNDALEMLSKVPDFELKRLKGVSSWFDLHQRSMRLVGLEPESAVAITIPDEILRLASTYQAPELKLVPLMRAEEFINVGDTLDICLGQSNYFTKATKGDSYCMTGVVDHKPTVAIELAKKDDTWKVLQYRGVKNSIPEDTNRMVAEIEAFLNTQELVAA